MQRECCALWLRKLSTVVFVALCCATQFGWNLMERASFQSLVFACYTFGFSLIAPTIQAVGLARTMYFGCGASVVRNAFNAVATSRCA